MKGPKYYAVAKGRTVGVFRTWDETKASVHGYPRAVYKSFATLEQAESFVRSSTVPETSRRVSAYFEYDVHFMEVSQCVPVLIVTPFAPRKAYLRYVNTPSAALDLQPETVLRRSCILLVLETIEVMVTQQEVRPPFHVEICSRFYNEYDQYLINTDGPGPSKRVMQLFELTLRRLVAQLRNLGVTISLGFTAKPSDAQNMLHNFGTVAYGRPRAIQLGLEQGFVESSDVPRDIMAAIEDLGAKMDVIRAP